MAIDPKEELSAAIARKQAILFAGAGISMAVGLPSWQMLMEHLASDLGVDPGWVERPRDSYQTLAESYRITRGRIGPLRNWMDRNWSVSPEKVRSSELHRLIVDLDSTTLPPISPLS